MATGIVKWFNAGKGYGFIQVNDTIDEVFVRSRSLSQGLTSLNDGLAVEFDIETDEEGRKYAVNVRGRSA